jgi:hypothetical protein
MASIFRLAADFEFLVEKLRQGFGDVMLVG